MAILAPSSLDGATRVWLAGVCFDAISEERVIEQVSASIIVGRGGWIATPNIHFLRRASEDAGLYALLSEATMRVPDGAPIIWANRIGRGNPLTRVTGSSLMLTMARAAARHGHSMYILGGRDGAAELAAEKLCEESPALRIAGAEGPWISSDLPVDEVEPIIARLVDADPDIVMVGVGFPKQERFIQMCRERLPHTWFLGCGAAINFAAGYERRAPRWMQRYGLEWIHRMKGEPRRLVRRYAADAPYALRLLGASAWQRVTKRTAPLSIPSTPGEILMLESSAPAVSERMLLPSTESLVSTGILETA